MFPKRLSRIPIYESPWIKLYTDKVELPSGKIIEKYHQLDYPSESVSVLIANIQGEICFIKSLRYTTQKEDWEIPAGQIEENESILDAAQREFFEETGLQTKDLKHTLSYNPSNGMSNQLVHVVVGSLENTPQANFDKDEVTEVYWLTRQQIKEMIIKNEIMDGISLLPLLLYLND